MLLWTAWSLNMMHNQLQLFPIIYIPTTIISGTISASLVPGIFLALLGGYIYSGGMTCTQHLCLRLVLTRAHATPWNYARFLNYCTERRLLQRIGGRYRFIHRELLDHFAGTSPQPCPDMERGF